MAVADPDLSPLAKCVPAVLIIRYHNEKPGQCNPSFSTIAESVGGNRRSDLNVAKIGWQSINSLRGGTLGATEKTSRGNVRFRSELRFIADPALITVSCYFGGT